MDSGTTLTLDLTSVTTESEFIEVCSRAIGLSEGDLFDLIDAYDAGPHPLIVTVIGLEEFARSIPTLAMYARIVLREIAERHKSEGSEVYFA